jgi:ribonuclease E
MTTDVVRTRARARAVRAIAMVVIGAWAMFSTLSAPAWAAAPSVSVFPASGLAPGAQVVFSAEGFPPVAPVQVDECAVSTTGHADPSRCTPVDATLLLTAPDGTVHGTATLVGCASPPCALAVIAVGVPGSEADAPIAFGAAPPVDAPAPPPAPGAAPPPATVAAPALVPAPVHAAAPAARVAGAGAAAVAGPSAPPAVHVRGSRQWAFGLAGVVAAAGAAGAYRARARRRPAQRG